MHKRLLHKGSSVASLQSDALIVEAVVLGDLRVLRRLRNMLLHEVVGRRDFDALPLTTMVLIHPRMVYDCWSEETTLIIPRCVIDADLARRDLAQKLRKLLLVALAIATSTDALGCDVRGARYWQKMPLGAINHHCVPRVGVVDGDLAVVMVVSARAGRVPLVDHDVVYVRRHHL